MGTAGRPAVHLCGSGTLAGADRLDPGCSVEAVAGFSGIPRGILSAPLKGELKMSI